VHLEAFRSDGRMAATLAGLMQGIHRIPAKPADGRTLLDRVERELFAGSAWRSRTPLSSYGDSLTRKPRSRMWRRPCATSQE
jgi:hypothetical protein